jgi:hypothetical protein
MDQTQFLQKLTEVSQITSIYTVTSVTLNKPLATRFSHGKVQKLKLDMSHLDYGKDLSEFGRRSGRNRKRTLG